jgi:predicted ABC-type ATPase
MPISATRPILTIRQCIGPQFLKKNNFELRLIYLCLNSIEEAQKRVDIRVENGGHFVSKEEIEKRYFDGFGGGIEYPGEQQIAKYRRF